MSQEDEKTGVEASNKFPKTSNKIAGKLSSFVSNITVEPTFFLTICTSMMYQFTTQNFYLEKACRVNIGYNTSICDALTDRNASGYTQNQEIEVQKLVSQMFAVRTTIQGFFPVCLVLFVGSWSDRHNRRKPAILFPIMGEIICCIFLILNVVFFYELPIIFTTLGDCLPLALLGGWPCLFLGVYSYVAIHSSNENRTVRVGAASACQLTGIVLGVGLSGFVLKGTGFLGFYVLCILIFSSAMIFGFLLIKETSTNAVKEKGFLRDFFKVKNIVSAFKVCFKTESTNRRKKLIILMLITTTIVGPIHGENSVAYLYTRYKFGWDYILYGTFYSTSALSQIFGSIFSLVVFAKILHFEDSFLGILALMGSTTTSLIYALAPNGTIFCLGIFFEVFYVTSHIAVRSIMSKLVPPNELGQVNSVFGVVEALMPLVFGPFYSLMYKSTIAIFPSTFHLFSATIKLIGFCCFVWLYLDVIRTKKNTAKAADNNVGLEPKNSV